jgi:flagellin
MVTSVGAGITATRQIAASSATTRTTQAQLGSGNRITTPSIDAASLAIGNVLRSDVAATSQAQRNVSQGSSMLQVAGGGLDQMGQLLDRMGQLAVQAGNGALGGAELGYIQEEMSQLTQQFTQTGEGTRFNGQSLLSGEARSVDFQVGEDSDTLASFTLGGLDTATLGLSALDVRSGGGARAALEAINSARDQVNSRVSSVGATQSRFEMVDANLETANQNRIAAKATFTDTDFASAAMDNANSRVLGNVSTALAAQANSLAPALLRLIG